MRIKRLLEKLNVSEGNTSYEDISKMRPIPNSDLIEGTLKDGTKFRLGIMKEKGFSSDEYSYAYVTLDKSKYCRTLYSGGEAGGGARDFRAFQPDKKYDATEFVKFV